MGKLARLLRKITDFIFCKHLPSEMHYQGANLPITLAQNAPSWSQDAPRTAQDGAKRLQVGAKMPQVGAKMPQDRAKMPPRRSRKAPSRSDESNQSTKRPNNPTTRPKERRDEEPTGRKAPRPRGLAECAKRLNPTHTLRMHVVLNNKKN